MHIYIFLFNNFRLGDKVEEKEKNEFKCKCACVRVLGIRFSE